MWHCPFAFRASGQRTYAGDVKALLDWVGLGDKLDALPPVLSGGEKQRAAIARAVISKPDIILADEPTGNVDPSLARRLLHLFAELNRGGTTVLIATHDESLLKQMKAPVLHLENGAVTDLVTDLISKPGSIVPKTAAPLRTLTAVMAVMCFLAVLAVGAMLLINRAVAQWASGLASEVTVQLPQLSTRDMEQDLVALTQVISGIEGIKGVTVLDRKEGEKLVAPWIGEDGLGCTANSPPHPRHGRRQAAAGFCGNGERPLKRQCQQRGSIHTDAGRRSCAAWPQP